MGVDRNDGPWQPETRLMLMPTPKKHPRPRRGVVRRSRRGEKDLDAKSSPHHARFEPNTTSEHAEVDVRIATDADLRVCARQLDETVGGGEERWYEVLLDDMQNPDAEVFVARLADARDQVIGQSRVRWYAPSLGTEREAPAGYYGLGMFVCPSARRFGVGRALLVARLDWVAARAAESYGYVNAANLPIVALVESLGFKEVTRDFEVAGVDFGDATPILYRIDLTSWAPA
jgi:GNAT superfamily N-acetyltransferase